MYFSICLCSILLGVGGISAKRLGLRFHLPWRAKANAAKEAAEAKQGLDHAARYPFLVIAEGVPTDGNVRHLVRLSKVSRFLLPYLLNTHPGRDQYRIFQRLATVDVEAVSFKNNEIAELLNAIKILQVSSPDKNLTEDVSSVSEALEVARRKGKAVTFY